jgi:hypothetical protein
MKFAHKLTLALLVVLAVVLSLCNTVLIGQQFRQELHTAQETLSADWQRESRAMQRTLVTPGSGSLAARAGSYLQAITEQNSLACAAYSVDGTSLYYALPTAVPLSEVEALLAQDGEWCWRTTIPYCAPERSFCRNAASPWSLRRMPPPCGRRGRPAPEMH